MTGVRPAILAIGLAVVVAGCGQKGPLVLPGPAAAPAIQTPVAADAVSEEEEADDE